MNNIRYLVTSLFLTAIIMSPVMSQAKTKSMPTYLGITLGMPGQEAISNLQANGWTLQPNDCRSMPKPCERSRARDLSLYPLPSVTAQDDVVLLRENERIKLDLATPTRPHSLGIVLSLEYASHTSKSRKLAPPVTSDWRRSTRERLIGLFGAPEQEIDSDQCGLGSKTPERFRWSFNGDRKIVTQARSLKDCRQIVEISMRFTDNINIDQAERQKLVDYLRSHVQTTAPTF